MSRDLSSIGRTIALDKQGIIFILRIEFIATRLLEKKMVS
jgi:hypothetical protein